VRLPDPRSRVFQIDLICMAGAALVGLGVWMGLLRPASALATQRDTLLLQVHQAEQNVERARQQIHTLGQDADHLQSLLMDELNSAPTVDDLNDVLDKTVQQAREAGLDVRSVIPEQPADRDDYVTYDVRIQAVGRSAQFIAFLDALAREHPYHSIEEFSVAGDPAAGEQGVCAVSTRVRLYLLKPHLRLDEESS
jgi:Tfp pilus assembly protein PilO